MTPRKALAKAEKEKKDKYLQDCLGRRRTLTPMVYYADIITSTDALEEQRRTALHLIFKLKWEYSEMFDFLQERMSLTIVISNSLLPCAPQDKEMQIRQ